MANIDYILIPGNLIEIKYCLLYPTLIQKEHAEVKMINLSKYKQQLQRTGNEKNYEPVSPQSNFVEILLQLCLSQQVETKQQVKNIYHRTM